MALHRGIALGALALLCLLIAALVPVRGQAAPAVVYFDTNSGQLYIVGGPKADFIAVTCAGGYVRVNGANPSTGPTRCRTVSSIAIQSGAGADRIDTTGVSHASGFSHQLLADPDPAYAINVYAGGGDDLILDGPLRAGALHGDSGDDVIRGGSGSELIISGGPGDDRVLGGRGDDGIYGDQGDDTLLGGKGRDFISAGAGGDRVFGGSKRDFVDGDAGNDLVAGGRGRDGVSGGAGSDSARGGRGADGLSGGTGNDGLAGNGGIDQGAGDAGIDRCWVEAANPSCES